MSKTGQWVFEMQEDATQMTLEEFAEKHGKAQEAVWHEVWAQADYDFMEMDDGAYIQAIIFQAYV
jgi:methenyltetrahydromethanopterin cyclohydrolase